LAVKKLYIMEPEKETKKRVRSPKKVAAVVPGQFDWGKREFNFMQQNNNPATGENNEWLPIDLENLPSHQLICEWKHPEYGIVIGNIVKYGGRLESEQSLWIFPVGGLDADIALSEFTHYRKIKPTIWNGWRINGKSFRDCALEAMEEYAQWAIAAERFRIVGIIEEATTGYQDELDRDILSSIGVKNNEVRIKELNRLKSLIQPLPTLSTI
jgi:hypothetical protein